MLNAPNNPCGRIYGDGLVIGLCKLAIEHDLTIINDEIYERIIFDGRTYRNPLNLCPEARDQMTARSARLFSNMPKSPRLPARPFCNPAFSGCPSRPASRSSIRRWAGYTLSYPRSNEPGLRPFLIRKKFMSDNIVDVSAQVPIRQV